MQGFVLSPTSLIGSRICSGAVRSTRSFNVCPTMASTLPNPTSTEDLSGIAANIKEITTPSDFQHTGTSALKLPAKSGSNFFDDILTSVFQIGGKLLWPNDNVSSNPPSPHMPHLHHRPSDPSHSAARAFLPSLSCGPSPPPSSSPPVRAALPAARGRGKRARAVREGGKGGREGNTPARRRCWRWGT